MVRRESLLIVEPEDRVRLPLVDALRNAGYQALSACNSTEAFLAAEDCLGPIHLLLSNLRVDAYFTGFTLCMQLRQTRPRLAALFLWRGNASDTHGQDFGALGPYLLSAPFTFEDLLGRIRWILDPAPAQ